LVLVYVPADHERRIIYRLDDYVADVCENGTIAAIGRSAVHRYRAERTIDASGRCVLPGGIDVRPPGHAVRRDDVRGDFETGTIAAAFGG
jgi:dihydropyrimidinase